MYIPSRIKERPVTKTRKIYYDRHRRIRKRIKIGGCYWMGKWLPEIRRTWGEVFIAKTKAKEFCKLCN